MLGADLHLLEATEIAEAHVQDRLGLDVGELELLHQDRLRLVLVADDLDHPVEVEIDDQVAFEHLQAAGDLFQPMGGAPDQHLAPVGEPFAEHLAEAHDARDDALREDVQVERYAGLEVGELEQRFHQERRVDRAAARLDDDAHVLGRFVADVGDERQPLPSTSSPIFSIRRDFCT